MVEAVDIKKFVNDILAKKGIPSVKNFAKEFSDGSKIKQYHYNIFIVLFQALFNILYDEKIDCKLEKSTLVETKMLNWNKINGIFIGNIMIFSFDLFQLSTVTILSCETFNESTCQGK